MLGRRAHPLVEAVVDDVHAAADAPRGPCDAAGEIEDAACTARRTRCRGRRGRRARTSRDRSSSAPSARRSREAVLAHEGSEPAALDVLWRRPPGDLAAELELRHDMVITPARAYNPSRHAPARDPTVILSACRTAIGSFGGSLKDVSAADLGAVVIREAISPRSVDAGESSAT